jgi:membrane associated rhomboid family serine protease
VSIELLLSLADFGFVASTRLREIVIEYGGFWPGLLDNWRENYPYQPQTMFFTYAFLHSGLLHLAINMITLWSLGTAVLRRVGLAKFVLIYAASILGGAMIFGLMAPDLRPMVGASGALFGLAGALLSWAYVDRFTFRQGLLPVVQAVALLIVLNLVLWWAMAGQLAWQTHLGGFLAGWIAALLVDPRPQDSKA